MDIVVWEGEWPMLKSAVRSVRQQSLSSVLAAKEFVSETAIDTAASAVSAVDYHVHQASLTVSRFCFRNPWVGQAALVTAATTFVVAKSARWGSFAALRNGVLAMGCATVAVFPQELRRAANDAFTTGGF